MLNRNVRTAVEQEKFHIWPVSKVEEAFELLTGFKTGEWDEKKQQFTEGSAFHTVYKELHKKDHPSSDSKKSSSKKKKVTSKKKKK